eukprot:403335136
MSRHEQENNLENYFRQSGKYKNQLFSRTQMNQSINQSRNAIIIDEGNLALQTDINQNLHQMRKIPNRLVIGDLNTFNQTLLEKTGKNFNSRQVGAYSTQTTSPLKMQKTVNASSMFKSQSSLKNQRKLRYHKIQVQDDELNKYVHQITERVKSNQMKESQMNGNIFNPQNDSQIISINEQTPAKIQITNLIKKLTIKKRSQGPFGLILRETSDQRKLDNYDKYQQTWQSFENYSTSYMQTRTNQNQSQLKQSSNRESLMKKAEEFTTNSLERQALQRALFSQQKYIPQQIWYDSLRNFNENQDTQQQTNGNQQRTRTSEGPRHRYQKLNSNKLTNIFARVKSICSSQDPDQGYRTQMLGCPNIEDLKNIKIEGSNKLESEINQCYRTEANQRYFCINANLIDLETGERELDHSNETIAKHIDKKLLY